MKLYFLICNFFMHANFILVYSFPAVCSISDGQWCNKKSCSYVAETLCCGWNKHFWFIFQFFLFFVVRFALQPSKNSSKTIHKKIKIKCCLTLNHSSFSLWFCRISTAHMLAVSLCCWACCVSRQGHKGICICMLCIFFSLMNEWSWKHKMI